MRRRTQVLLWGGAAVALVVVFLLVRPGDDSENDNAATTTTKVSVTSETTSTTVTVPAATAIRISYANGELAGGIQRVTVKQGDRVRVSAQSDVADEVHIHGYDLHMDLEPGTTETLIFKADIAGGFEMELEELGLQVAELTVEP